MSDAPGRLTLRAIEIFVAVMEEGSLAFAARRLNASTSSVSQQLTNLEAALGVRLIDRTARPLVLTPAGHVFQRRALAILDEAARAKSELAELELTRLPALRLAVIDDFDADVTPGLAARLAAWLPGCELIFHGGPSHENIAALDAREVDIVIAADLGDPPDRVERHPILRDPFVLAVAPGVPASAPDPVAALMAVPMIRYVPTQIMGQQIDTHLRRLRLAPPRAMAFEQTHSVLAAVAESGGWAIVTPLGWHRAQRFHDRLTLAPLPFAGFARTVSLTARRGVFGELPARIAAEVAGLAEANCIAPLTARHAWLCDRLRCLEPAPV